MNLDHILFRPKEIPVFTVAARPYKNLAFLKFSFAVRSSGFSVLVRVMDNSPTREFRCRRFAVERFADAVFRVTSALRRHVATPHAVLPTRSFLW